MKPTKLRDGEVLVPLDKLHEDPDNTNVMEPERYAILVENMRVFGCTQPALVRPTKGREGEYDIVDGHHRKHVAAELGWKTLPCKVGDYDDQQRRLLNVSMNRLRGEPDLSKVAMAVRELSDAGCGPGDLRLMGFSDEELDALLKASAPDDDLLDDGLGHAPEPEKPAALFVIELQFNEREDYQRAKKALKRIGGGDSARAVLALIDAGVEA